MTLKERIEAGIAGKYQGLNNGFSLINKYIFGIQKGTYYLMGGQSGTYKTTLTDFVILNAIQDAKRRGIPLNVFYYSFEIDRLTKQCNWLSILAFQKYNRVISPEKIKGLGDYRLSTDEQEIINDCIPDLEEIFSQINFEFTPTNPTGIFHQCWKFLETKGKFEYSQYTNSDGQVKEKISKYIPDNPHEITLGVVDHCYHIKKEREFDVKQTLDKHSEYCIQLRNLFGMTWWNIQQFNRGLSSIERQKFKGVDISPQESDFKDSGNLYQDADVVLGTMNPYKLDMDECLGYDINRLKQNFIMLKIIKNRLSVDNIAIGLYANPKAGSFLELPPPSQVNYSQYE